jgi:hypothetical protein
MGHIQCSRVIRQDDSTLHTPGKTSFSTPSHYDPRCCKGFQPPQGHLSDPGSQYNSLTLSYKRLGEAALHRGRSRDRSREGSVGGRKGRLRQGRLKQYHSVLLWM